MLNATKSLFRPLKGSFLNYTGKLGEAKTTKPRIVILGCGWGSYAFLKKLKTHDYEVTVISPRNHFLFTPLLASTSVGTLEFRSIAEPIRNTIKENFNYLQAACTEINPTTNTISCVSTLHKKPFEVQYDKLIIGVGATNNTFGIPGVEKYAHFLKELDQARTIRKKIIECFEFASLPDCSVQERERLLSFVVVGGGPTGVEFAAELNDFFLEDLTRFFPNAPVNEVKITLLEASGKILSAFDEKLVKKALLNFKTSGVNVQTHSGVKDVSNERVLLNDGTEIPYGLLVWSTGNKPIQLINESKLEKDKHGRLLTDGYLRVKSHPNIFAFGDCGQIEGTPLPATAAVAQQQGLYLAKEFNKDPSEVLSPFKFHFLGMLVNIGRHNSLFQTKVIDFSGFFAFLSWRSVYLTRLGSIRAKFQVPFDWTRTLLFGRDISQF
ncbi:hypothetical protein CYY_000812 [Polysphondylium violaceum]|uniref:NADH dehydrogenase n=1 Tax=Polysphondylium violaceum TaxID=133409 RepID=A0A8J4V229_9MYCE|nr:hypothetical protein CYY_000812 [Polysphondylium violaceum]